MVHRTALPAAAPAWRFLPRPAVWGSLGRALQCGEPRASCFSAPRPAGPVSPAAPRHPECTRLQRVSRRQLLPRMVERLYDSEPRMGVVPCPRFECQILTFPGAPDCEAVPGRLWPGRRPLTTALGPAALGVRFSPGRSRSGQPLAPRCPQPSGAAASGSLHCGVRPPRRAGGLRGSAHSEHLIPLPPRPRALGAPGTPECPGGGAGTPAWPLAVARDSRGGDQPAEPFNSFQTH